MNRESHIYEEPVYIVSEPEKFTWSGWFVQNRPVIIIVVAVMMTALGVILAR